jgi:hypothetical protein
MSSVDPGVEGNARLTGYAGVALVALLGIELFTGLLVRRYLPLHVVVGFLVIPPVLLKLGSVGYRFARYYTNDPPYRIAGAPALSMRVLGPILVVLTVIVFGSGVELWIFGYRFGFYWIAIHHGSSYLWFVAAGIHVVNYARRAPALAVADWRDHLRGTFTRQSLVVGSLVAGAVLAIAMLSFASPFALVSGGD